MNEKLEMVMKDKQQFSKDQERTLNIESDIAELKQMAHQQSGLSIQLCLILKKNNNNVFFLK